MHRNIKKKKYFSLERTDDEMEDGGRMVSLYALMPYDRSADGRKEGGRSGISNNP
jgi:hypothetical protein